ncbi:MAG: nitronate monooxygenase [Geminicoccaceae bacterium]
MPLPAPLHGRLRLPVVAAPMFLVSGPALVVACCRAGILGSFPSLNQRSVGGLAAWLDEIEGSLGAGDAPYAVNLIVHDTNTRLDADLDLCVARRVPVVITSFGARLDVIRRVKDYGGIVFHDVISRRHAEKAIEAGVDGLILVSAGAGGHAGTLNPIAFCRELRGFYDGCILLSGSIGDGAGIAAARAMGADLAYMGTRFIATAESAAADRYKAMIGQGHMADIVYTPNISGVNANFLAASIVEAGLDPAAPPRPFRPDMGKELDHGQKAWKDIWSAGHGIGSIDDCPPVSELVDRLDREYRQAITDLGGEIARNR